jgi:hypothetical protein
MIDVDYSAGLQVWNHSQEHTNKYIQMKQQFEANSAKYLKQKNKEAYRTEQYNYWDFYYTHYPEYLPPSIPKGEKYKLFVQAAADMMVDAMFTNKSPEKTNAYNKAYSSLSYYQINGKNYVGFDSFLKMIKTYMELMEQGFRAVYDNSEYAIMHEVLPEKFQLKMKLSQIAQVWIPYLEEKNADYFLEKYNLKDEYVDIEEPQRYQVICEDCKNELTVPKGALVCICEHCRHQNFLRNTAHCHNCGFENKLPENWNNMISCEACSTQLRVVQPLFG